MQFTAAILLLGREVLSGCYRDSIEVCLLLSLWLESYGSLGTAFTDQKLCRRHHFQFTDDVRREPLFVHCGSTPPIWDLARPSRAQCIASDRLRSDINVNIRRIVCHGSYTLVRERSGQFSDAFTNGKILEKWSVKYTINIYQNEANELIWSYKSRKMYTSIDNSRDKIIFQCSCLLQ